MKNILVVAFGIGMLSACTTAKMPIDPELNNNAYVYKITEKPRLFSGDKISFGPYLASNIDRSFMKGTSSEVAFYKNEKKNQTYAYDFMGKSSWKAICEMGGKGQKISGVLFNGSIEFGKEIALNCSFSLEGQEMPEFAFSLVGSRLVEAKGDFKADEMNIRVAVINKLQGSGFSTGIPTGFYFYSGEKLIASIDSVSSDGPVLFEKSLSDEVKDRVGLVMVALLLVKE